MGYNEIRILPEVLSTLSTLTTLNVAGNLLENISSNLKFPRLTTLDCSRNRIRDLPLNYVDTLTDLNLAGSELNDIPNVGLQRCSLSNFVEFSLRFL